VGDLTALSTTGLPAEIAPLVDEFNGLLARLAAAWQALGNFTADAAHELRSPLAALRLQLQSLQRARADEDRELATHRLLAGVDRATRLVEQLLALARHDGTAGGQDFAPVDLAQLARRATRDAQADANVRHIRLEGPGDAAAVTVPGQADALTVLLRNLIDNALRHVPDGGTVRVTARMADGGAAELVVEDSGPGIPPEERQRVLDRFYRVPGAPGHGSGLGLAIVQAVARRHGAQARVDASPELGGARVRVCWQSPE